MNKILETDLFYPVKSLLEKNGYRVCGEIENCDIAAMKDEELIIIELKKSLNIELLLQAIKRQRLTENVFIGIPRLKVMSQKKWKDLCLLIKRLGLGLIVVYLVDEPYAEVIFEPTVFDLIKSLRQGKSKRRKLMKEFSGRTIDNNIGGSTGKKILTAYKELSLYIACCLYLLGPLSPKELRLYGADKVKTNSILSKNFNNWFYRVKNGIYDISDEGKQALIRYQEITEIHKEVIKEKIKTD